MLLNKRIPVSQPAPPRHQVKTLPPPMRGMNRAVMALNGSPDQCLLAENWIIDQFGCVVRDGWSVFCENVGSSHRIVRTLICSAAKNVAPNMEDPYVVPGPGKLFAATDDGIYDVTTSSAAPASVLSLSGTTLAGHINYVQFPIEGGLYVAACSETDGYLLYNAQTDTWSKVLQDMTDPPAAGKIYGCDPAKFVFVLAWKRRLLFVERDTGKMWYLPVGVFAGKVLPFDFGPLFSHGGVLSSLASWTQDAGVGIDDQLVVLSTMGDVLVYKGTDPGDVDQFSNVGVWYLGAPPAGRRSMTEYGGECLILSEIGITPVSVIVQGGAAGGSQGRANIALNIRPMLAAQISDWAGSYGWDMTHYPTLNLLIVNTPPGNISSRQYCLALNFAAWSIFTGMPAMTFEVFNHNLYFGTEDGRVCLGLYGDLDEIERDHTGGLAITSRLIGTFNVYDQPAFNKQFHMVRPVIDARQKPQASLWVNVDYRIRDDKNSPAFRPITVSRWDQDHWDSARWSGTKVPYNDWFGVQGLGRVGSYGLAMASLSGTRLYQLDVLYEITKKVF